MKKILILGLLLLGSLSFGASIKTGKNNKCVSSSYYSMDYEGIASYNDGYYAHLYEYANCEIGGKYFRNVSIAIISKSKYELTNSLSSLTFRPGQTVYYDPTEDKISFNIDKIASWKR